MILPLLRGGAAFRCFMVDQLYRPPSTRVFGAFVTLIVLAQAIVQIPCHPGVEGVVAAAHYIDEPVIVGHWGYCGHWGCGLCPNASTGWSMIENIPMTEAGEVAVAQRLADACLSGLAHIRGVRLALRPPLPPDAGAVYAYACDPLVTRFLAWPRHITLADSERFLRKAMADWVHGQDLVWVIEVDGDVIGAIGARISGVNAGIGYVLRRTSWGRGYAAEALQLLCDALSTQSRVQALWALCVPENVASARVLEKGGFHPERTLDNYFSCPNEGNKPRDVVLYTRRLGSTRRRQSSLRSRL